MADPIGTRPSLTARSGSKPSKVTDGVDTNLRCSNYGEQFTQTLQRHQLSDEGSYFIITNPTPGTGLAGHAAPTTVDDTKPFFLLKNNNTVLDGSKLYLDFILIQCTAAGTGGTNLRWTAKTDASGVNRYTSGGSSLTAVNPNNGSSAIPSVTAFGGAVLAPAASSAARLMGSFLARPVINVVGDTYLMRFGPTGGASPRLNSLLVNGTNPAQVEYDFDAVIVDAQATFLLHQTSASQSAAASYEIKAGFWIR